jgi:hypothetical protein
MDCDRIQKNLKKTAELIDTVFTLKLSRLKARHPELSDREARSHVYQGILQRKELQWTKQLAGRPVDLMDIDALRETLQEESELP